MSSVPQILINQFSFALSESFIPFENINLVFSQKRYGVVGDNGMGKTTLLKLIAGLIAPHTGNVQCNGALVYCPQNIPIKNQTIAEVLEFNHDWNLIKDIQIVLRKFNLENLDFHRPFATLSGGQQTQCLVAKALISQADFILLDEPTNNLDLQARSRLYHWIDQTKLGLLVASHDRLLLDRMDEIIEITTMGINHYGGNYSFYQEQKKIENDAQNHHLIIAKQKMERTLTSIQSTYEKHAQRSKKGKNLKRQGKIDKLAANSKRGRSERSQSRNTKLAQQMLQQSQHQLQHVKDQIEIKESIHANLIATAVPKAKTILKIEGLTFSYPNQPLLFNDFNLSLVGPQRLGLVGNNGTGKTTLIQLTLGELQPLSGTIHSDRSKICYLDQDISFLDSNLSILENCLKHNPDLSTQEAYSRLAAFNFRNRDAIKPGKILSGGERVRAGLAISLLAKKPPELIILDEPTNHLDIRSIESIECSLRAFLGAILVISHDARFLKNVLVNKIITLGDYNG